jgi:hypothetical protein
MASLDLLAVHLALRNRALAVSVATTGSTNLSATATGYHRAAGSFVTDGFAVGMEITPVGFTTNTVDILTRVTAADLTTKTARTVEAVAGSRTISVGLPMLRAYENVTFTPIGGRPYVEEDFTPATSTLLGMRDGGYIYDDGLYSLKWYGLSGYGVAALRQSVDALKRLFAPGTALTAGSNVVRVRTDTASQTGQIIPIAGGWSVLVLSIPWVAESINVVAA